MDTFIQGRAASRSNQIGFKDTYIDGLRCKGFRFSLPAGISVFSLDLSGMAKVFKGIAFANVTSLTVTTQLTINNDVVIESSDARFFSVNGNEQPREAYPFLRGLNGQDTISLSFTNTGAIVSISVLVYYI